MRFQVGAGRDISGWNAIVTGASRGIGSAIAAPLADRGVNLALVARSGSDLEVAAKEARALVVDRATAEPGPIDLLVNNAGLDLTRRDIEAQPARSRTSSSWTCWSRCS